MAEFVWQALADYAVDRRAAFDSSFTRFQVTRWENITHKASANRRKRVRTFPGFLHHPKINSSERTQNVQFTKRGAVFTVFSVWGVAHTNESKAWSWSLYQVLRIATLQSKTIYQLPLMVSVVICWKRMRLKKKLQQPNMTTRHLPNRTASIRRWSERRGIGRSTFCLPALASLSVSEMCGGFLTCATKMVEVCISSITILHHLYPNLRVFW